MDLGHRLLRIRELSDEALLEGLGHVLGANRQLVALVVAHLGEVEERRLHLIRGHGTLFAYCTGRLGMSEDEAWRRIEVARLARRFPILLEQLGAGRLSLSVAALLKHHLNDSNHVALLAAVAGKTIRQAHEVLAAWFPKADVPPTIRKLPMRRSSFEPSSVEPEAVCALSLPFEPRPFSETELGVPAAAAGLDHERGLPSVAASSDASTPSTWAGAEQSATEQTTAGPTAADRIAAVQTAAAVQTTAVQITAGQTDTARSAVLQNIAEPRAQRAATECTIPQSLQRPPARTNHVASAIAPLSPGRYRVQFTASDELTRKLELVRDLLRHAEPQADLAAIVERAIDLLLEKTLQRRFAKASKPRINEPGTRSASTPPANRTAEHAPPPGSSSAPGARGTDAVTNHTGPTATTSEEGPAPTLECTPPSSTSPSALRPSVSEPSASQPLAPLPSVSQRSGPSPARYVPAEVRRTVLERDGLRCTWCGPDGVRCESRAWLEHDHVIPWGLGGTNSAENIRIYCRPHNRLAAEQAYGQSTITRIIARRHRSNGVRAP